MGVVIRLAQAANTAFDQYCSGTLNRFWDRSPIKSPRLTPKSSPGPASLENSSRHPIVQYPGSKPQSVSQVQWDCPETAAKRHVAADVIHYRIFPAAPLSESFRSSAERLHLARQPCYARGGKKGPNPVASVLAGHRVRRANPHRCQAISPTYF